MKWYHWLVLLIIFSGGGYMAYKATRGIRNKNPGNIRFNKYNDWIGQVGQDDEGFIIFSDVAYGIRAMARLITNYQSNGHRTVAQIITRWAPPNENNTQAYINSVVKQMDLPGADFIPAKNEGDYHALIKAIIKHENGVQPYEDELISKAISLA